MDKYIKQLKKLEKQLSEIHESIYVECPGAFEMTREQFEHFDNMTDHIRNARFYVKRALCSAALYEKATEEAK